MNTYSLTINEPCKDTISFDYNYSHVRGIQLTIGKDFASITYQTTSIPPENIDCFMERKNDLLRDAIRKILLLHSLKYDHLLIIKKLSVQINEEHKTFSPEQSHFLKVHTMLSHKPMHLENAWHEKAFLDYLAHATKSSAKKDQQFSAIEAFLASKSIENELDRFTHLWTSMNALYTHYADQCYGRLEPVLKSTLEDNTNGALKELARSNEKACISLFARLIKKDASLQGIDTKSMQPETYHKIGGLISHLSEEEVNLLYSKSLQNMKNCTPDKNSLISEYGDLMQHCENENIPLFLFILLRFPYLCRCNYVHGSHPVILTAFEDEYELRYLKNINRILDRFLETQLPIMFAYDIDLIRNCYCTTCLECSIGKKDFLSKVKRIPSEKLREADNAILNTF